MKPNPDFTDTELEVIISMWAIADAGAASEGDYQDWSPAMYRAADSAAGKAQEVLSARRGQLSPPIAAAKSYRPSSLRCQRGLCRAYAVGGGYCRRHQQKGGAKERNEATDKG